MLNLKQAPSLIIAVGIIVATLIAKHFPQSGFVALLLLAITITAAGLWNAKRRSKLPSWLVGATCLVSGLIITVIDPAQILLFIPTLGASMWVALLLPRNNNCGGTHV